MQSGCCCGECHPSRAGLVNAEPRLLVRAQWSWPPSAYAIYRMMVAIYFLVWLAFDGATNEIGVKYFIFLSNWALIIQTATLLIQAVIATVALHPGQSDLLRDVRLPAYLRLQWVLYNLSTLGAFAVTILALTTFVRHPDQGGVLTAASIHKHVTNSVLALVDIFISAIPVRLLHVYHSAIYALVYVLFVVIYDILGGTNGIGEPFIYPELDFTGNLTTAVISSALTVLVGVPVLWLVIFGLYRLRLLIVQSHQQPQQSVHFPDTDPSLHPAFISRPYGIYGAGRCNLATNY